VKIFQALHQQNIECTAQIHTMKMQQARNVVDIAHLCTKEETVLFAPV